ncbi:hypothetical protein BD408DRAFT_409498 [Parasitella parasitica]|nr:hypothetical protein BD408DRAFT_409498 [Parasitella parasitica]
MINLCNFMSSSLVLSLSLSILLSLSSLLVSFFVLVIGIDCYLHHQYDNWYHHYLRYLRHPELLDLAIG